MLSKGRAPAEDSAQYRIPKGVTVPPSLQGLVFCQFAIAGTLGFFDAEALALVGFVLGI